MNLDSFSSPSLPIVWDHLLHSYIVPINLVVELLDMYCYPILVITPLHSLSMFRYSDLEISLCLSDVCMSPVAVFAWNLIHHLELFSGILAFTLIVSVLVSSWI